MTTLPPLFVLAAGGKPRLRRARMPVPTELALHIPVAQLLKDHAIPDWQWTHIPSGEHRDIRTAAKLKAMGSRRGWPDFILISPYGSVRCLELKRAGGKLTRDQEAFRLWCVRRGVPFVIASTMDEVLTAFADWGCLRVTYTTRITAHAEVSEVKA